MQKNTFTPEYDKDLSALNTLAVPAKVAHYAAAHSLGELLAIVHWAKSHEQTIHVLGGGSNVIPRAHIEGIVVQPKLKGISLVDDSSDELSYESAQESDDKPTQDASDDVFVRIGAGENWHQAVSYCVSLGYFGIENLALIPGDAGAAPIQNIGAYGVELKDVFHSLEALNLNTLVLETFTHSDCAFGYRDSVFKGAKRSQYIITSVTLKLSKIPSVNLSYPALREYLGKEYLGEQVNEASPQDVMNAVIAIRRQKLPDPVNIPNAGSFFKNPIISVDVCEVLKDRFPDMPTYPVDEQAYKLAAAWLIEKAGWKGREYAGVAVHSEHALVLTNPKRQNAEAIHRAVVSIQKDVQAMFGVALELEPRTLG